MPEDPALLTSRLERARRRAADATPFSPDWDAAMALIEDLERRLTEFGEHDVARDDPNLTAAVL